MSKFSWILGSGCLVFAWATSAAAADYYVDPSTGSMQNDGSAQHPWSTLQEVIDGNLVETREWAQLPYEPGGDLKPRNPGAPVKAGDTIWLRSGYHGDIFIQSAYNAALITIAAESGQTPQIRALHVQAASNWLIRGLSISPEYATPYDPVDLVFLESHDFRGPTDHVTVEDCEIFSMSDVSGWSLTDWNDLPCNGIRINGDDCTVRGNRLRNVNFGISVSGERGLVEYNTVDSFAGDGMRGLGNYGTFQYNTVKNCYDVNGNHDDGFQSWSVGGDGQVGTGEVVGITLRGNTIINYEDPNQPFRGTLQGLGCFDGTFVDWVVENNLIITDHWHGITLMGARNSRIVNNTVLDLNDTDPGPPWISITPHKNGTASTGCVVRNNLTTDVNVPAGQDVEVDNNLIIDDPTVHFVDPASFDMHLKATSPAVDTGSSQDAPAADHDEIPRPQGAAVDVGAYEYYDGPPVYPDAGPDGAAGSGASGGSGGASGSGGSTGGSGGGTAGSGGASGTDGGTAGSGGGTAGSGGASTDGGAGAPAASVDSTDDGGCGCRAAGREGSGSNAWFALGLLALLVRRKTGRRSRAQGRPSSPPFRLERNRRHDRGFRRVSQHCTNPRTRAPK